MRLILIFIFIGFSSPAPAQTVYKAGNTIENFKPETVLNFAEQNADFNYLKKEITIIDFFGTWCIPCLRALPHLDSLQRQFPERLRVMLISVEKKTPLQKFVSENKARNFPLLVDESKNISNLFQPPSYPYTVVVNASGEILAITEASEITGAKIEAWLKLKVNTNGIKNEPVIHMDNITLVQNEAAQNVNKYNELSEQFIYAAKTGSDVSELIMSLEKINLDSLEANLSNDDEIKAFWINIYNGFTQYYLKKDPEQYKTRGKFFQAKQINVGGYKWSLDQIEHDLLRRSKIKWSLGYLNKIFVEKRIKKLRVDHLDYRLHFALNCGAKSCPPIAFYDPNHLNTQLDVATKSYLTGEAEYDAAKNKLYLPAIMGWFRRDFKGKKNMLKLVKKLGIVPMDKFPNISFKKYDWNLYLNNYNN